ncbi:hypothetical protein F4823DRAFT_245525 [Ustulina deusta]|nr:hypothetical protein F4823DRAFT_245525 [Ustulina deusta]
MGRFTSNGVDRRPSLLNLSNNTRCTPGGRHEIGERKEWAISFGVGRWRLARIVDLMTRRFAFDVLWKCALGLSDCVLERGRGSKRLVRGARGYGGVSRGCCSGRRPGFRESGGNGGREPEVVVGKIFGRGVRVKTRKGRRRRWSRERGRGRRLGAGVGVLGRRRACTVEIFVDVVVVVAVAVVVVAVVVVGVGGKCKARVFNGSLREPSEHGLSVTFSVTFFLRVGQRGGGLEFCTGKERTGLEQSVGV